MGYEFTMHKMENSYWKLFWITVQKYTQNATKLLNLMYIYVCVELKKRGGGVYVNFPVNMCLWDYLPRMFGSTDWGKAELIIENLFLKSCYLLHIF